MSCRVAVFKDLPSHRACPTQEIQRSPEAQKLEERRRAVSHIFPGMSRMLSAYLHNDVSRHNLQNITQAISAAKNIPLDRIAKRSKEGMICWLCEVVPELADRSAPAPSFDLKVSAPDTTVEKKESESDSDLQDFGLDENLRKEEDKMLREYF
jgi:hypothetical protein